MNVQEAIDSINDEFVWGRRIRTLSIDKDTRECLAQSLDVLLPSVTVLRVLPAVAEVRSWPTRIISYDGPEMVVRALTRGRTK